MRKAYVFLADGFEEIEGLTVVDILRRGQINTVTVSVSGSQRVTGSHQITVTADMLFEEIDGSDADLLVLPGGMPGTRNLREHKDLCSLLVDAFEGGTRLAAICAAPTVFGKLGLLEGKKAICYPGMESQLTGAEVTVLPVVTDGTITTSRGMGTAIPFALELLKLMTDEVTAAKMAEAIVFA